MGVPRREVVQHKTVSKLKCANARRMQQGCWQQRASCVHCVLLNFQMYSCAQDEARLLAAESILRALGVTEQIEM